MSIGGKSTELGKQTFLERAARNRARILAEQPRYIRTELPDGYAGTLSKPVVNRPTKRNRKGKEMPKATTKLNNVVDIAGKRGRKSEFNSADWVQEIGLDNAFDVTEEMLSGIAKLPEKDRFKPDVLFTNDNATANKYRSNRFGAMKRASVAANGEGTKNELKVAENENNERIWIFVRTA